ncbi:MAG TPA: hypothetical protein VG321_04445 [Solirubrobacteraceae bacterium]|jgi:hypothetical protein|nr:hypothetical protein [Solirubrobacteraceae bacterium]
MTSSVTSITTVPPPTLGEALECDRLERRARRVTVAVAVLRERVRRHRPELDTPPQQLLNAIADFEAQIEVLNGRLRDLGRIPVSIQVQETERPK